MIYVLSAGKGSNLGLCKLLTMYFEMASASGLAAVKRNGRLMGNKIANEEINSILPGAKPQRFREILNRKKQ